jgi:hypothetical protein
MNIQVSDRMHEKNDREKVRKQQGNSDEFNKKYYDGNIGSGALLAAELTPLT